MSLVNQLEYFFFVIDRSEIKILELIREIIEWHENIRSRKMVIPGKDIGADIDFVFIDPDYNELIHDVDSAITELIVA